jgi:hypothetical protein
MRFLRNIARALTLVSVCFAITSALAQYRASIQGVITDPQGAVVPGATVTLIDKETGRTLTTTSNDTGVYNFQALSPSHYSMTVERTGFKKKALEDLTVLAEQSNSVNVELELGQTTETVTVTGATPAIDTETANIAATISSREVQNLPSIGRDPFQLLRLAPGVFGDGANGSGGGSRGLPGTNQNASSPTGSIFMTENQPGIIAGGVRANGNTYEIDGVNVNSLVWGGSTIITPNEESVKEVRVQASEYSAENGRGAGAQVTVVSQNGTNDIHGSFFFKIHRPGLDAYQRWNGPGSAVQRDNGRFNQFGGSIGGPLIKNRFFLFFSYESLRNGSVNFSNGWYVTPQFNSNAAAVTGSIASQWASRTGVDAVVSSINAKTCGDANLTDGVDCQAVTGGLDIGSPLTSALGTKDSTYGQEGTPFGIGNGLDGVPDVFNVNTINPTTQVSTQYNGRADFQATKKDLVAFSVYWVPNDTTNFNGPSRPINLWHSNRLNYSGALLWNRTISSTMLNEARFNISRWWFNEQQSNPQMLFGFPNGNITNIGNIGLVGPAFGPPGPGIFYDTSYNARDTLSKVYRSHSLKFGADIYKDQIQEVVTWAGLPPAYQFNNLWDWANDAPLWEQGNFDPRTGKPTGTKKNMRSNVDGFFVQDDYRVRSNLTLNLGLRWEYLGPLHEKDGNLGVVNLGSGIDTLTGLSVKDHRNAYDVSHKNFGPQIGFAWSPSGAFGHDFNNKFVLRGGFGIGFTRPQPAITLDGRFNIPITTYFNNLRGSQLLYAPAADVHDVFSFPANPAAVETFDPTTGLPTCAPETCGAVSLSAFDHFQNTETVYRYSLMGQYELANHWVASVGYQGSQSRSLFRHIGNLNWFYPNNLNSAVSSVSFWPNDVSAHYNALLTEIQHQFARAYTFDVQYTYSRCIDQGTQDYYGDPYPFNARAAEGNCENDVAHAFKAYGLWSPRIFQGANDWREKILGGWQLSGIFNYHSGFPFGAFLDGVQYNGGCNLIYSGSNFCQATLAGYLGGAGNNYSNSTFKAPFGNFAQLALANTVTGENAYFTMPTFTGSGIPPAPGIKRNPFRGPRYLDLDFTLGKDFGLPTMKVLGEGAKLAIRANFYNIFNTLNLTPFTGYQSIGSLQVDSSNQIIGFHPNQSFGQAQSALGARVVELQARFNF